MSHQFPDDPFAALGRDPDPKPDAGAREKAIAAARMAFASAQAGRAKKFDRPTQGTSAGQRLISIINSFKRISIMDLRIPIGTAAIALLVLPLGVQLYNSTMLTPGVVPARQLAERVVEIAPPAPVPEMGMPAAAPQQDMAGSADMAVAPQSGSPAQTTSQHVSVGSRAAPMSAIAPAMNQKVSTSGVGFHQPPMASSQISGDSFAEFDEQRLKLVAEEPVSTFSIDVDTASYAYTRRMLEDGFVPEPDAIRIEELINYFPYDYPAASDAAQPFAPQVMVYPTPWNARTQIMQIGIRGQDLPADMAQKSNLVFLIDTSGSMDAPDKLPLLKRAFGLLLDQLSGDDSVSIVAYAGSAGLVLEPTSADQKAKILAALETLQPGGGTAGAEGITLAYRLAQQAMIEGGTNRVILATDGDFNVGIADPKALETFIKAKRDSGVSLSVLGFGRGNLGDATMQALAQTGNGNASYISSFAEARKVLVEEIGGTLHTIASDVKIQVEFNPAVVAEYRLIGYETRALNREDFNNDAVDAGEVGAGHSVTALYEITPLGSGGEAVDPLRYGTATPLAEASGEIAHLRMRYKLPGSDVSQLLEVPVTPELAYGDIEDAGVDAQFAAAVAAFGQKLKGSAYGASIGWDEIRQLARAGRGEDIGGYRAGFIGLVDMAALLKPDRK